MGMRGSEQESREGQWERSCLSNVKVWKRYEEFLLMEASLWELLGVLCVASLAWLGMVLTRGSDLLLWPTITLTVSYFSALIFGFLYCYTVWIYQTKNMTTSSSVINYFNRLAVENFFFLGFVLGLVVPVGCGVASLIRNYFDIPELVDGFYLPDVLSALARCCVPIALFHLYNTNSKKHFLLQLKLEETKKALSQAEDKVMMMEERNTDMHHMIGSMSHDLKTPLQAFTFELENLHDECQKLNYPSKIPEFKSIARENISQLKLIISFMTMAVNRSLDYTKVSTGVELVPAKSPVNISETMTWVMDRLAHKLRKSVTIVVEPLKNEISKEVVTDKQWLIENLFCFLSNAQKFTSEGQISLRCVTGTPDLHSIDRKKPMVVIEVEDSGIGLSDAQKNRLFQPFQQAQSRAGGTGLGLFSLFKRVECLGGSCGVRDRPNKQSGSIFWFSFPYVPYISLDQNTCTTDSLSGKSKISEPLPSRCNSGRRILVVDDSILIQKATKKCLERQGYNVDVANNGYECLKIINSKEYTYDLILLDLNMPIMDGLETITRLREQEFKSRFGCEDSLSCSKANVVVGFSANSDPDTKAEALEAGMDEFLSKPLAAEDIEVLSSLLKHDCV